MKTANEIFEVLSASFQDSDSEAELTQRVLDALEDGEALSFFGLGEEDQEAIEELHSRLSESKEA